MSCNCADFVVCAVKPKGERPDARADVTFEADVAGRRSGTGEESDLGVVIDETL